MTILSKRISGVRGKESPPRVPRQQGRFVDEICDDHNDHKCEEYARLRFW